MIIDRIVVGPLQTNCYLIADPDSQQGAVIDPGDDPQRITAMIDDHQVEVVAILCTHGHPDHMEAAVQVAAATGLDEIYLHPADIKKMADSTGSQLSSALKPLLTEYDEGDQIMVGDLTIEVFPTPGHSPGSICLTIPPALFTGDTLFAGGVGRTDLPGGSSAELQASLRRIVAAFPPETAIYPGHGPTSTLADQLASNPWLTDLR